MLLSPSNLGHVIRLARAGYVLAREGVFSGIDSRTVPVEARLPLAAAKLLARRGTAGGVARLPAAITQLGPSYIKLGQFLATPARCRRRRGRAGTRSPPRPRPAVSASDLDRHGGGRLRPADHRDLLGVLGTGRRGLGRPGPPGPGGGRWPEVAVKVARPGVARLFRRDLSDLYFAARLAERMLPDGKRLKPVEVVDTLARSVTMEMDFRIEAAAASEFGENAQGDPDFRVPAIDWDLTAKDVLTLDWVHGASLADLATLRAQGIDLPDLGRIVVQSFLRHAVRDGFFHADMHQGNLFVGLDGKLVAVDFGIMAASASRSAGSSPRSSTASSPAITSGWPRSISRPAMCPAITASTTSPRRSAP